MRDYRSKFDFDGDSDYDATINGLGVEVRVYDEGTPDEAAEWWVYDGDDVLRNDWEFTAAAAFENAVETAENS